MKSGMFHMDFSEKGYKGQGLQGVNIYQQLRFVIMNFLYLYMYIYIYVCVCLKARLGHESKNLNVFFPIPSDSL